MKRQNLFFILMAFILCSGMRAQEPVKDGSSFLNAIPVTISSGQVSFTDMQNTEEGIYYTYPYYSPTFEQYMWTEGRVVFYRLETKTKGEFIIHNWGSDLGCTTLFLVTPLDPTLEPELDSAAYPVDMIGISDKYAYHNLEELNAPDYALPNMGYIHVKDLPAGVYYIITGAYKCGNVDVRNGNIRTTITGSLAGETPEDPGLQPEHPNNSSVQYQYDLSGNRIKTIKKN